MPVQLMRRSTSSTGNSSRLSTLLSSTSTPLSLQQVLHAEHLQQCNFRISFSGCTSFLRQKLNIFFRVCPGPGVENVPEPGLGDVPDQVNKVYTVQDVPEPGVEDVSVSGLRDVPEQAVQDVPEPGVEGVPMP
jgi:hypothetical protein